MNKRIEYLLISLLVISCKSSIVPIGSKDIEIKQDSLAFELAEIYGFDQGIRSLNLKFSDLHLIQKIDTINFHKVINFIEKNGFPRKELLGEKNLKFDCVEAAATAVLLHNPHRLINETKYFSLFLSEVKKGNLKADVFATILDKYYWTKSSNKNNRRVFYGSQFGKPCIQTKETTNKARVEIGLNTLKDEEFIDCAGEVLDMPKKRK